MPAAVPSTLRQRLAAAAEILTQDRMAEGEALLRGILATHPSSAEALHYLSLVLIRSNRLDEADRILGRLTRADPKFQPGHNNRGAVLTGLGRHNEAVASFDRALALSPRDAEAWNNRGFTLSLARKPVEALRSLDKALSLNPGYASAENHRGIVLGQLGRPAEALESFDRAIGLEPGNADFLVNRGVEQSRALRYDDALSSHESALAVRPDKWEAHRGRGAALESLMRYNEAIAAYDRALESRPGDVGSLTGRANTLFALGRYHEALDCYEAAITMQPDYADAHWDESHCLLAMGDYARGWKKFEWRWQSALAPVRRRFAQPLWLGDTAPEGKTLLIYAEQGLGDTLQFCRYVPLAAERTRVVLEVPRALLKLLSGLPGIAEIVAEGDRLPKFDLQTPMMSLPLAFRSTLETLPATMPYLRADPGQAAAWRARLAGLPGRKIGLVWSGAPRPDDLGASAIDRRRSIALNHFAPLAELSGVSFISLQKGTPAAQARTPPAGMKLLDWTTELDDFTDTAALIEALDLVVTVDTSVAHLAGALGRPVWILNRYDQCWRWLRDRTDSPWYPTARLFHQETPGDWTGAIDEVTAALEQTPWP